jgi:hypothetical protein
MKKGEAIMKLIRKDLPGISEAINTLLSSGSVTSKRLVHTLVKNTKILEVEVEAFKKAYETDSDEYKEFVTKVREVYAKYGRKDEAGKLVDAEGKPGFDLNEEADRDEFEKAIKALEKKYEKAIASRKEEVKKYEEFLAEEIELPVVSINFESLPEDIAPAVMYTLDELITEPAE